MLQRSSSGSSDDVDTKPNPEKLKRLREASSEGSSTGENSLIPQKKIKSEAPVKRQRDTTSEDSESAVTPKRVKPEPIDSKRQRDPASSVENSDESPDSKKVKLEPQNLKRPASSDSDQDNQAKRACTQPN